MIEQLGGDLVPVLAILCGFTFVSIWVIAATVHSVVKIWMNNKLKYKLLERGYSATEIAKIINAGNATEDEEEATVASRPAPPVKRTAAF